mmetsp:Transcript_16676/g.39237  ORF Transcript_16676/g.39237 Transcript_16676/m.39237 type:complete len:98 (+) Transcript_16676:108-401(+)
MRGGVFRHGCLLLPPLTANAVLTGGLVLTGGCAVFSSARTCRSLELLSGIACSPFTPRRWRRVLSCHLCAAATWRLFCEPPSTFGRGLGRSALEQQG